MAQSVGSVVIDLEARVTKLESDLGRAAVIADRKCKEIQDSFKMLAVGVAGYFSGKAIIDWLQSSIDAADEISKMSQKVGISTETLSGWSKAAQQAGVDQNALTMGLVKLAKAQDDAKAGNKQTVADLQRVGLSMKDIQTGDLQSNFEKISDTFAKYGDGASKAAAATKVFGKAGVELVPLLNAGSDGLKQYVQWAKAYGIAVSTDGAKSAENFNDTLERLKWVGQGLSMQITQQLTPALAALADKANAFFQSADWKKFLDGVSASAKWVADNIDEIITALKYLAETWSMIFALNVTKNIIDWGLALASASKAATEAGAAVKGFSAITQASFANAYKSIGALGIAFNLLGAAIIGAQIGNYLSDQFLEVRLAGIAFVDGTLVGWEKIKQGAKLAWAAIEYAWDATMDAMKAQFAETLSGIAAGFQAIGASDASAQVSDYAKRLTSGASAGDKFAAAQAKINAEAEKNIKAIHQTTGEMVDYEAEQERLKNKTAKTPTLPTPKPPQMPGPVDVAGIQKAQDAMKGLADAVDNLYAENLKTGDKITDQQAQSMRQLAAEGAKAIEAGANAKDVQALIVRGNEQIALTAQKARDEQNKQFDDWVKQQQQKLQDDKDELALKVASVGMSDKEIQQAQALLQISKDTTDQMRKLVDARDKGQMTDAEFEKKSQAITDLEQQRVQATLDANAAIDKANADWLNGAQKATKNFLDQAQNLAQQTSEIISSAFSGFVDTFAELLTTGKADFKSFATSILSDLAKMETRIAMSKILTGVFGMSNTGSFGWGGVAKGDVFGGPGIAALSGGIYNRPTRFFARGGNVLGEAGWEGVLPLRRNSSGQLGVMAQGGGNVASNSVNVVVNIDNGGAASTNASGSDDQMRTLGNLIAAKCKEVMTNEQRPGGILWRQAHG